MYFILQGGLANGKLKIEYVFLIDLFLPEGSAWDTGHHQVGASLSSSRGVLEDSILFINHF